MTTLLLLAASLSAGWLAYSAAQGFLDLFSRNLQEVKLRNLAQPGSRGKRRLPWEGLLLLAEGRLAEFPGKGSGYARFLRDLARRATQVEVPASRILAQQVLTGIVLCLFFLALIGNLLLGLSGLLLGACLPLLRLRDLALMRERRILRELPNALESLSLCSEAGLSLEQGMDEYARNAGAGPLKDEFALILAQTRSGASRKTALLEAATRLGLTDFTLFTSSLTQAERFGTGVSKTLRQLSLTLRDKQTQRAEKAVQELPVKLLLPLILCIMPVTFLVIFAPVILQFVAP